MPRKRTRRHCAVVDGCGIQFTGDAHISDSKSSLFEAVNPILTRQRAVASLAERRRFVVTLERAIRQRDVVSKLWSKITSDHNDIISLIQISLSSGDVDEAIWRCFLAAHFGRSSARGERQIQSGSRFLCAFHRSPVWTWKQVSRDPDALREWLSECDDLESLRYGSHRKYESQKPELIWSVIESFILLVDEFDTPTRLFSVGADEADDGFDCLYRRLRPVLRFGRTGRFDFLILLFDLGFISAEPIRPYLRGSTGPLAGAKLMWGTRSPNALDMLAADLSAQLSVSPIVMEDALCNWQK